MSDITEHAVIRMKQRGIAQVTIDYLLDFGREAEGWNGGKVVYFDKATRLKLMAQLSKTERTRFEHQADAYLVIGNDGKVVTVGHRTRRMAKH